MKQPGALIIRDIWTKTVTVLSVLDPTRWFSLIAPLPFSLLLFHRWMLHFTSVIIATTHRVQKRIIFIKAIIKPTQ